MHRASDNPEGFVVLELDSVPRLCAALMLNAARLDAILGLDADRELVAITGVFATALLERVKRCR
jgi:hypothetical protein